jgi:two-component system chemotaxis response regulator CheB
LTSARVHDVIVIGASAGGIAALREIVAGLPGDLPATILIVLHVNPTTPSALPAILDRATELEVRHARKGDRIRPGSVLIAPPDLQMTIADGFVRLERGPLEHGLRPAIDSLMRSAAAQLGPRVVGVVLSGMLSDGTAGLAAIKAAGGVTVVQDPATAAFASMPGNAVDAVDPDHVVPLSQLAPLLQRLVARERGGGRVTVGVRRP